MWLPLPLSMSKPAGAGGDSSAVIKVISSNHEQPWGFWKALTGLHTGCFQDCLHPPWGSCTEATGWKALSQGQEAGGAGHGLPSCVEALTAGA